MTRSTRKTTTETPQSISAQDGENLLPSEIFVKQYGRAPDFADDADWKIMAELYTTKYGTLPGAGSGTLADAKTSRKVYVPEPPPTFADDCEDTPVPMTKLLEILAYQRFAGTQGEKDMIDSVLMPLPGLKEDDYGNYWLRLDHPDGTPATTLFSSHTDTVEKQKAKGLKELELKGAMLTTKGGGVLGADDGAGIWLMLNLIEAGVPGLYIFHREEEIGGGGSTYIANKLPGQLVGIKRAIAFDRKDLNHIITHQGGERCCSDTFAKAFAAQLNDACEGFDFHGDDTGSFTDTKNYVDLIPECTNLSAGYYDQHTQHECQDLSFVTRLANALIKVEWELLPTERDPKEVDDRWGGWRNSYNRFDRADKEDDFEALTGLVADNPEAVAQILLDCGYDLWGVETEIDRLNNR